MHLRATLTVVVTAALTMGALAAPASALDSPPGELPPLNDGALALTTYLDDADESAFSYVGEWTHASGQSWTERDYHDTESFSTQPGSRVTLQFFGTGVEIFGPRGSNGGAFRVSVDCGAPIAGDSYAPWKVYRDSLVKLEGLPRTMHTVVIETQGSHQPASSDSVVMVDYAVAIDDPAADFPTARWKGAPSGTRSNDAVPLRRAGCGASASLVNQLKARTVDGWFTVPGAKTWGAVNGHSVDFAGGRAAAGPVLVGGQVRDAATIALAAHKPVSLKLALPDRPRSLLLRVAADEVVGSVVRFGVGSAAGDFLPAVVLRNSGGEWWSERSSEAVQLHPGEETVFAVDLRGASGVAAHQDLVLWAESASGAPAELDILEGRTSELAFTRLARDVDADSFVVDQSQVAAPRSSFAYGPVVLSRVLADSGQPAWTGDQNSTAGDGSQPVPITFGTLASGARLTVDNRVLPVDTIALTLPQVGWPQQTSSVHVRLETGQRCRTLTASVGIDDSTPDRRSASVSVAVYSNGESLPLRHNGLWTASDFPGAPDSPVTDGRQRELLARQLLDAQTAASASADPTTRAALDALHGAQEEALAATSSNESMAITGYSVASPLVLGAGFSGDRPDALFAPANLPTDPQGHIRNYVGATSLDSHALFPLAVDLVSPRGLATVRDAATHSLASAANLASPLVDVVDLVISGTPGATVDLVGAGLDCVTTQPAADGTPAPARVMPRWSQIGVPPLFLPAPRAADGTASWQLGLSPMWWDLACPNGPSTAGLTYTATRTRLTSYVKLGRHPFETDAVRVDEVAVSTQPACGLPADQVASRFGEFALAPGSAAAPTDPEYHVAFQRTTDTLADRLVGIDGSWSEQLQAWASTAAADTLEDPLTFAIWAALAPFDLPAAIVFNPFTQHALPVSTQVALGGAFMVAGEAKLIAGLPAASGLASTAAHSIEGTNELLFMTAEQAHADGSAVMNLADAELAIPVRSGASGPIADLTLRPVSTPLVLTDPVVASLPVATEHAAWVEDGFAQEVRRVCKRDIPRCTTLQTSGNWRGDWEDGGDLMFPDADRPPADPIGHLGANPNNPAVGGFWARNPQAQVSTARGLPNGAWPTERSEVAWQETLEFAEDSAALDANGVHLYLPDHEEYRPIAVSTSTETVYIYSDLPPSQVFSSDTGITAWAEALAAYDEDGWEAGLNLVNLTSADRDTSLFVMASRDPDLLSSQFSAQGKETGFYRYRVERPDGGGIDVRATLAQNGLPDAFQNLANLPQVLERAELAFPGGVPARAISMGSRMEFNPSTLRFEVIENTRNPAYVGAPVTPTEAELAGASIQGSTVHAWAQFDWWLTAIHGTEPLEIHFGPIQAEVDELAEQPGSRLIYTKHAGWTFYEPSFELTDQALRDADFVSGTWNGATVWIPRNGAPLEVTTGEGWVPHPVG